MQFCPTCDNKLNMRSFSQEGQEECTVALYCKNCTYTKELDKDARGMCMYRSNYSKEHPLYYRSLVNKFTPYDMTLPRSTDIPCPSGCEKSEVVYIRYDDENVRYLYLCCKCNTCWRMPSYQTSEILFRVGEESDASSA